ncbi:hypothetical protein MGU_07151 [Metarhizium guizhouense ARSEF 977]|uniref:Uncharacterized protein n=1 Tax=Metarhizium guizhouense (strain ARSEF 977) TaxID=1276136 RepID=A0A0B4I0C2_METGA|nr:hypothetical protein MGU_07151 [Metarhizium guizhouense ARSEF 977]
MKAAAVTLASLAAPALALASARPGEGFRILRRANIWDDFCNQAFKDAQAKCREERNGGGFDECYVVGQDASMECLVDHSKVPDASDAVHVQCRAEAVKGARACFDGGFQKSWGTCYNEQLKAYPDCVKKDKVTTTSGQSQSPAATASTVCG